MKRCKWCNLNNPKYIEYHDKEWGKANHNDKYLYEMLILECFQAGLSWECILNKRDNFRNAYDNFDINKVSLYDENKINELLNNKDIIRNKLKIKASINNTIIFKTIVNQYGSFYNYLKMFTNNRIIYEVDKTINEFFIDTTYKIIPNKYRPYKMLTISFLLVNATKIFCFVLYKFQDFISYNRIIKYLKENYDFQPRIVHTDYEKALYINFLKNNIYDYKILQTICFLLFTKSIREKMVKLKLSKKKLSLKSYEVLKNIELLCFIDKKNLQK